MSKDQAVVKYDDNGMFEITEQDLLASVAAGLYDVHTTVNVTNTSADHVCNSQVDTGCNKPTNSTCVAPDGVCGSNVGCDHISVGA